MGPLAILMKPKSRVIAAHNHEGGCVVLETFTQAGEGSLFTNGIELLLAEDFF